MLAPWKVRVTADGAGTLDAVHATIELVDRARLDVAWPWVWHRGDDLVDPTVLWVDRTGNGRDLIETTNSDELVIDTDAIDGHNALGTTSTSRMTVGGLDTATYDRYVFANGLTYVIVMETRSAGTRDATLVMEDPDRMFFSSIDFDWDPDIPQQFFLGQDTSEVGYEDDLGGVWPVWSALVFRRPVGTAPTAYVNGSEMAGRKDADLSNDPPASAWHGLRVYTTEQSIAEFIVFDGDYDPAVDVLPFGPDGEQTINAYLANRYPSLFT